jgi:16S rRNA (guanine966-N2)-methyltransferase
MRIVSGRWRRHSLAGPIGKTTRPMPERVREAIFEKIGSRWGTLGKLPPVRVLDVFAGNGGVGLEALSRGAVWCGFVERDRDSLKVLRSNVSSVLGQEAHTLAQVLAADAYRVGNWQRRLRHARIDLVSVDPPFRDSHDPAPAGRVGRLLESLAGGTLLADDAIVVLRHESRVDYDQHTYSGLQVMDVRRYGNMKITYLTNGNVEAR